MKRFGYFLLVIFCFSSCLNKGKEGREVPGKKPNIVIIYVDDLGYADVGSYGAKGVKTPNIDLLAAGGVKFTDGHSSAATCTPSRFSLLTGTYAFRNNAAILKGDAPLLIAPERTTISEMLQEAGYRTGIVGKWHLGLGNGYLDWNEDIKPGPNEVGFDYSFIMPATGDRVPTVFVENHKVVGLDPADPIEISYSEKIGNEPTGLSHPGLLKMKADVQHSGTIVNGVSRIGYMTGGKSARWKDEEFADVFAQKAKAFIAENSDQPFFLFFSLHDIHVPRLPNPRFIGKSDMGLRGDAIVQADWSTGEIIKKLKELGIEKNTLVIFTSDNGPVLDDGYADGAVEKLGEHNPSGPFRGGKYSAYEAGTRVPTIAYWPGVIQPGKSSALVSQIDLYASLAKLTGQELKASEAPDSREMLDVWLGKSEKGREILVEESFVLALRKGNWKYISPGKKAPQWLSNKAVESGLKERPQLFNLEDDPGEQNDLALENPEKVKQMQQALKEIVEREKG